MATNNNMDYNNPQFLAFMEMIKNGQINMPNSNNLNQVPNMNQMPNNNEFNNQNTVFISPNQQQNQFNNNMFNNGVNMMNFGNFNPNAFPINNNMNMNMNMNINPQNQGDNWILIFEKKPENSRLNIQISSSETVAKAFQKCREKLMLLDTPLNFTYNNGKQLDPKLTLSASGLNDGSVITVKVGIQNQQNQQQVQQTKNNQNLSQNNFSNQMSNQIDRNQMNLIFQNQTENTTVSIQIKFDKLIKDAINSYKNKIQKNIEAIYILLLILRLELLLNLLLILMILI